jgi:hypothetical protein
MITGWDHFPAYRQAGKALQTRIFRNLWVTNDVTDSELLDGYGMLAAKTLKGAAVRLFKQPYPVPQHCFLQLMG